jgi:hypothetical protein
LREASAAFCYSTSISTVHIVIQSFKPYLLAAALVKGSDKIVQFLNRDGHDACVWGASFPDCVVKNVESGGEEAGWRRLWCV